MPVLTPSREPFSGKVQARPDAFRTITPLPPNHPRSRRISSVLKPVALNKPGRADSTCTYARRFQELNKKRMDLSPDSAKIFITPCKPKIEDLSAKFNFIAAVGSRPHPEKQNNGEDAFFVDDQGQCLGIADGVGGWSDLGIDAGLYSRELMSLCKEILANEETFPEMAVIKAYERIKAEGSTTCCLLRLQSETRQIRAANLGDSGFILIRKVARKPKLHSNFADDDKENYPHNENIEPEEEDNIHDQFHWRAVFRTNEQQHYFNCPRQLGTDSVDQPFDCDRYAVSFCPGDIALLATDGVLDNLSMQEICAVVDLVDRDHSRLNASNLRSFNENLTPRPIKTVRNLFSPKKRLRTGSPVPSKQAVDPNPSIKFGEAADSAFLNDVAKKLTQEAFLASIDLQKSSPFERNALLNGIRYKGGKMDDITVVVARIVEHVPNPCPFPVKGSLNFDSLSRN